MPSAEMVHTWRLANAQGGGGWQALAVHQEPDCENHHNKQRFTMCWYHMTAGGDCIRAP